MLEGALQIRDIATQNLAMGAKLLWSLVSGKTSWRKHVLWKKYFQGQHSRCLDQHPRIQRGLPTYMLCMRALELFKARLYWVPGNGKTIKIWDDPILGDPLLGQNEELENIKRWHQNKNLITLGDISIWGDDENRSWENWNLGDYPEALEEEAMKLLDLLQGKSPLNAKTKDKRG